ncbi:hypothetical protein GCM10010503_31230 [Streptomyces lucensis JCM 4490]|uniref:Integral membrane protein n=1 Tax=Streptomyces lucensis JCM 4490 TaxID=1306176 RepID=A0A918J6J8_9ACTN|nr:DUF2637 domain-containing protein [Streptomyces lucensis]GGW52034.1 hypothetical protein GCM10010503_31230 [Streptomyces lucensis JCM 4490]
MYHERMGYYPDPAADYSDGYQSVGDGHWTPTETFYHSLNSPLGSPLNSPLGAPSNAPLIPPEASWDPAEELAFMLRDAIEEQQPRIPSARKEDHLGDPVPKSHREILEEITAELPPVNRPRRGHRKVRARQRPSGIRVISYCIAALATVVAAAVSIFGGLIAYDPLRIVAVSQSHSDVVSWWPILVFGPWLVAALAIFRAALHQRRAFHSWCMLLAFSAIAMTLCVAPAPKNVVDTAVAALPSFASLACFQQVVRQITMTRPPRRALPRHRVHVAEAAAAVAAPGKRPGRAA